MLKFIDFLLLLIKQHKMSKFLNRSKEDLKTKIFSKLNLTTSEDLEGQINREMLLIDNSHQHLDKILKQTEKRKLSIRKLINSNNGHSDFSDQMAQLKWRIEALRNFTRNQKERILMSHKATSLTGKQELPSRQLTFDQLYQLQKKKFSLLRERRKTKVSDPKYVEMIGNMQLRKQKRKLMSKQKIQDQMRIMNEKMQEKIG